MFFPDPHLTISPELESAVNCFSIELIDIVGHNSHISDFVNLPIFSLIALLTNSSAGFS